MKAWQFTDTGAPLVLSEVDEPAAVPGEVVIDIKAAGLCHTDVGVLDDAGWRDTLATTPITIGHEVAGVVSAIGDGVSGWSVGDRVGVCPVSPVTPGFARDGGYSFKLATDPDFLVRIPDSVSFAQGAAGTDAGMTSYHAVMVAGQVAAGDKVGIIGLGGLGQIGARVAVLSGASVYVADIAEDARSLAESIGAVGCSTSISDFADENLDVIVDFAGFETAGPAIDVVRVGGRVVQVGMGKLTATISVKSMIMRQVTYIGSNGGTVDDIANVYAYMASGDLAPEITEISFDEIPDGIERLRSGAVTGRLVAMMG